MGKMCNKITRRKHAQTKQELAPKHATFVWKVHAKNAVNFLEILGAAAVQITAMLIS